MSDVFLSYSLPDAPVAARLAEQMQKEGISVFWHSNLDQGSELGNRVSGAIAGARVFVLLHPGDARSSGFVRRETQAALARSFSDGLLVLPVLLPGREPLDDVGTFRYFRTTSRQDFKPVVKVVQDLLRDTRPPRGQSLAGQRLSFLSSLLRADLDQAPQAASVILDEIAQTVGGGAQHIERQLELLRQAVTWAESHLGAEHPSAVSLRFRLTEALMRSGRYEESLSLSSRAVDDAATPADRLQAKLNLSHALLEGGRLDEANKQYQRALGIARETGLVSGQATCLIGLGTVARMRGDLMEARRRYEEAVEITAQLGQPNTRLGALVGLCEVMAGPGDAAARRRYEDEILWLSETALDPGDPLALRASALLGAEGKDR